MRAVVRIALAFVVLAGAASWTPAAQAQTYPNKPIRMIVSIAAGSVTDVIMRVAAAELQTRLGQPLVIRLGKMGDADDAYVDFDSVKLMVERTAADGVTIRRQGGSFVIEWTGGGTLQESEALASQWKDVSGATSPHTRPIGTLPTRFFQVRP